MPTGCGPMFRTARAAVTSVSAILILAALGIYSFTQHRRAGVFLLGAGLGTLVTVLLRVLLGGCLLDRLKSRQHSRKQAIPLHHPESEHPLARGVRGPKATEGSESSGDE